jgi:hypothetical protein
MRQNNWHFAWDVETSVHFERKSIHAYRSEKCLEWYLLKSHIQLKVPIRGALFYTKEPLTRSKSTCGTTGYNTRYTPSIYIKIIKSKEHTSTRTQEMFQSATIPQQTKQWNIHKNSIRRKCSKPESTCHKELTLRSKPEAIFYFLTLTKYNIHIITCNLLLSN